MCKPRVLVFEDEAAVQVLLVELFARAGYQVLTAMPDDCLERVGAFEPHVVLVGCDSRGTFERGWDVLERLRPLCPDASFIMLSTNYAVVQEVGHTARGRLFDAGLRKPFSVDELLTTAAHRCAPLMAVQQ